MTPRRSTPQETTGVASTTLLLVALITVLAGVGGVIAVAQSATAWSVVGALVVLLAGLVVVTRTMSRQLDDDGDADPLG